jgi:hypothetical protein
MDMEEEPHSGGAEYVKMGEGGEEKHFMAMEVGRFLAFSRSRWAPGPTRVIWMSWNGRRRESSEKLLKISISVYQGYELTRKHVQRDKV